MSNKGDKKSGQEKASMFVEGMTFMRSESHKTEFGPWRYDADALTLAIYEGERLGYEIDLERMQTSAAMLDWIFQVRGKSWCAPDVMASLLEALDEIFDPQSGMCRGGVERGRSNIVVMRPA